MQRSSIIAAITAIAVGLVALQYWNATRPKPAPLPSLVRDLPKDVKAAQWKFGERVGKRFPAGSPSEAVTRELSAEGFHIEAMNGRWQAASLTRMLYPCAITWRVRWRSEAGKVVGILTAYRLACP